MAPLMDNFGISEFRWLTAVATAPIVRPMVSLLDIGVIIFAMYQI